MSIFDGLLRVIGEDGRERAATVAEEAGFMAFCAALGRMSPEERAACAREHVSKARGGPRK